MLNGVGSVLKRRDGAIGLAILLFFVLIAILSPLITPYKNPYNPDEYFVAAPNALPMWMRVFPGFSKLPPDIIIPANLSFQAFKSPSSIDYWELEKPTNADVNLGYDANQGPLSLNPQVAGSFVVANTGNGSELVNIAGTGDKPFTVNIVHRFTYEYAPPNMFYMQMALEPLNTSGAGVAVYMYIRSPKGVYPLALVTNTVGEGQLESFGRNANAYLNYFSTVEPSVLSLGKWEFVYAISTSSEYMPLAFLNRSINTLNVPEEIFSQEGNYTVGISIEIFPQGNYSVRLLESDIKFEVFGDVYGLMGTDSNGADVWSEYVSATRLALEIGFGASAVAMGVGVSLGLVAGFFGGIVDSVLIFVFDFLLLIPGLVLLIDLDTVFTVTHFVPNKVALLILIIGGLGWAGISRVVRSQVMSMRSRSFIEAAEIMGVSKIGVLRNHIMKHVAGMVIALITYIVPGLVLADVGLDFLGLGIVKEPTWGNMLSFLLTSANPENGYLWWISLPVGISIIAISVGFYLLGSSIQDEISRQE